MLAFLVAALLTAILQSANAVCVFGISLAAVGVISVDQAIMVIYGTCLGSSAILYLLSAGLTGRSRQVAMYMVLYDVLVCVVLVPLLYWELHFETPLMKTLVLARQPRPGPTARACLCPDQRVPPSCHARRPGMVGLGARTAVAELAGRCVVKAEVHSRPGLRRRRHIAAARRSGATARGEEPVALL